MNNKRLISLIEGAQLVRLARTAVEKYLENSVIIQSEKDTLEKAGVFVTISYLTTSRKEYLRGCIGFPLPEKTLPQGVIEAAIAAATEDPRFPPLDRQELNNVIFEVSVLTPPKQITVSPADF
nr:TIGR00296 family protein [Thermoproteota archaeon]